MGYTHIRVIHYREPGPQVHANTGRPQLATVAPQPGTGLPSCFSEWLSRASRPVSHHSPVHSTYSQRPLVPSLPIGHKRGVDRQGMGLRLMLASRARADRRAQRSPTPVSYARSAAEGEKPYESVGEFCQNLNNSSGIRAIVLIAQGCSPHKLCNGHSVNFARAACGRMGARVQATAGDLVPQLVAWHGTGSSTQRGGPARNTLTRRAIQRAVAGQARAIASGRSGPPPPWGLGCPIPKTGRKT